MSQAGDRALARCRQILEDIISKSSIDGFRFELVAKKLPADAIMETRCGGGAESRTHFDIYLDPVRVERLDDAELKARTGHEFMHAILWGYTARALEVLEPHVPEGRFREAKEELAQAEEAICYRTQSLWRRLLGAEDPVIVTREE